MKIWELQEFRNDLSIFIQLLKSHLVTGDFTELEKTLDDLSSKSIIEYEIKNLAFNIKGSLVGTKPENMNHCQIFLDNMLMVRKPLNETLDPLHAYSLDLSINLFAKSNPGEKAYNSSWHLDRHLKNDKVKYTHPSYHFQFGGKRLEYLDPNMGILASPRIPHPPMDVFLAIHFILSNFYNNKLFRFVNSLLEDHDYQQIIIRAQERLWVPYFNAFSSTNTHLDFSVKKVFPLFLN